jgi:hypothetical protein
LPSRWDKKGCNHCREKQRHYGIRVAFLTAINNEESPLSPLWGDVRLERGKCSEKTAPNRDRNVIVVAVRRIRFAVASEKNFTSLAKHVLSSQSPRYRAPCRFFFYCLENNVSSEIFYRQQQQTVESMESVTTTRDGATRVLEFRAPPEDDRSTRPSSPIYDVSRCISHHNQTSTPSHSCVAPFGYLYMREVHDAFPATVALLNIKFLDVLLVRTHQSRRFRLAVTREGYQMVVGVGAYRPRR